MDISDYSPAADARRFDSGTPPVPNIYAGLAGMGIVEEAGVAAIEAHVRGLVDHLLAGLDELGATVVTPRGDGEYGPLVCVASTDPEALVARSRRAGSSRRRATRASACRSTSTTSAEDVDRILAALAANRRLLADRRS